MIQSTIGREGKIIKFEVKDQSIKPIIPDELIEEIFIRLPARSLMQFRCISKSWRSFLSNPDVINSHIIRTQSKATSNNYKEDEYKLVCFLPNTNSVHIGNPETCNFHNAMEFDDIYSNNGLKIHLSCETKFSYSYSIIGSCNGLICVMQKYTSNHEIYFLINPLIRDRRQEYYPRDGSFNPRNYGARYGFGYDSATQDYKIVRLMSYNGVDIFSLKNNCWTSIIRRENEIPLIPYLNPLGIAAEVNGVLNWICLEGCILTFDLSTNKYGRLCGMPQDKDEIHNTYNIAVSVFHGCLCLTQKIMSGVYNIWMMKKYGNEDTWTKLIHLEQNVSGHSLFKPTPLCYSNNGRLLLWKDKLQFFLYNIEDGSTRICRVPQKFSHKDVVAHRESFVSPKCHIRI